ncbi:MAG: alpha/beta hydrolase [Candidatus Azambacteria bacterium]|nr:alpha/beta hydrolase [Candidatus Azambacteria bacterium]
MSLFNEMDSRKTIIFLHGWGASSKIFQPFYHYFKNDFAVHFLDLPGFGESPIKKPMFLKDYADFVCEFIKNNNIKEPIIVGHSFGGAVAAKLAILYPETMSKLILVGASAIRQPRRILKLLKILADLLKPMMSLNLRKFILKLLNLDETDWAQIESPILKKTFINVIGEDLSNDLHFIKTPTLVIWGENDTVTPLKEGKLIAENIPNTKLAVVKNAGHFLFLEKPEEFIKLIKEFAL